ncbi:homeobox and leucine zipper encoding b isoform X2 [Mugil cephalus]|nr:homeobox and leucine zipper encoding b isoform X2 [Mugil cephalus]
MSKMVVDGGLPKLRQQTPNVCEDTQTSSDVSTGPETFSKSQTSPLCLPLVSESGKLIWVHSHQIDLHMDGAAEMDKAFDRFPYLTQKQTEALAQRCSLHPDQVKVWFMAQRLRYGISWDYKDIFESRRKYLSGQMNVQGKEAPQNRMEGEVLKGTAKMKKQTSGGIKAGDVRVENSPTVGENVLANLELERKTKQEPLVKKKNKKLEGDKSSAQKKRKRMTVTDKVGKKNMKEGNEGLLERVLEGEVKKDQVQSKGKKCTQSGPEMDTSSLIILRPETSTFNAYPLTDSPIIDLLRGVPCSTPIIPPVNDSYTGEKEKQAGPVGAPREDEQDQNIIVTDIAKLKELIETKDSPVAADDPTPYVQQQDSLALQSCAFSTLSRHSKTQAQLTMMKMAFLQCQYPGSEGYSKLAKLIGIQRHALVQYFADMRYYVKKMKPRWMNHEQHRQTVANIKYRQLRDSLVKAEQDEGGATWKETL